MLIFLSRRLLYGIIKLYGEYGVNNLNTPFNVTYTEGGGFVRKCEASRLKGG